MKYTSKNDTMPDKNAVVHLSYGNTTASLINKMNLSNTHEGYEVNLTKPCLQVGNAQCSKVHGRVQPAQTGMIISLPPCLCSGARKTLSGIHREFVGRRLAR